MRHGGHGCGGGQRAPLVPGRAGGAQGPRLLSLPRLQSKAGNVLSSFGAGETPQIRVKGGARAGAGGSDTDGGAHRRQCPVSADMAPLLLLFWLGSGKQPPAGVTSRGTSPVQSLGGLQGGAPGQNQTLPQASTPGPGNCPGSACLLSLCPWGHMSLTPIQGGYQHSEGPPTPGEPPAMCRHS